MIVFVTGLGLIIIFALAYLGPRLFDFTLVYVALAQIAAVLGMNPDTFIRFFPIVGATLMVIGNYMHLMAPVTCDNCGWVGPKRRFIQGCAKCGGHKYH
jgi:predicted Zn-ribbon and HTH transcriptional regulator